MAPLQKKPKRKTKSKPQATVKQRLAKQAAHRKKSAAARNRKNVKKRDTAKTKGKVGAQKRAQNRINKAAGKTGPGGKKHTRKTIKQANKRDKAWSSASSSAKKSGTTMNSLVKKRSGLKKGSAEYKKVQNQINKHYGVKKRHK